MNEEKEKILEKLAKMLTLAKDQKGKPEGEAAYQMACRMMAKYRIKETEVDLNTDSLLLDTYRYYVDGKSVPQWVSRIVAMVSFTFNCQSIIRNGYMYNDYEVIGTTSDVETVKYFIAIVCSHVRKAGFTTWPKKPNWKKRQQLGNHAADIIWIRLQEMKKEMDSNVYEDDKCMDLVVRKDKEVQAAVDELYPNLRSSKRRKTDYANDSKTINAGIKAGKTANLNYGITE